MTCRSILASSFHDIDIPLFSHAEFFLFLNALYAVAVKAISAGLSV